MATFKGHNKGNNKFLTRLIVVKVYLEQPSLINDTVSAWQSSTTVMTDS